MVPYRGETGSLILPGERDFFGVVQGHAGSPDLIERSSDRRFPNDCWIPGN
jgi:hypothetical protein